MCRAFKLPFILLIIGMMIFPASNMSEQSFKIAYSAYSPGERYSIFVMDSDGSNAKRLIHWHAVSACSSWSPDGRIIVHQETYPFQPLIEEDQDAEVESR